MIATLHLTQEGVLMLLHLLAVARRQKAKLSRAVAFGQTLKELLTKCGFGPRDPTRNGGIIHPKRLRGAAKRAFPNYGEDGFDVFPVKLHDMRNRMSCMQIHAFSHVAFPFI
jgi:hypothetical protein